MKLAHYVFCLASLVAFGVNASNVSLDSLYRELEKNMDNAQAFVDKREARITLMKDHLKSATNDEERYKDSYSLYMLYKSYMNDSAITYLDKCLTVAQRMQRPELQLTVKSRLAFQCSTSGMYTEALDILASVNRQNYKEVDLGDYYTAYNHVYGELAYYGRMPSVRAQCREKSVMYRDSMYQVLDDSNIDYFMRRELELYDSGRNDEAMALNDKWMKMMKPDTHEYAIVSYYRSQVYERMGNIEMTKYWLVKSAICDIQEAVMDHASLWNLARILADEGDWDRSYKYIRFSWNATTCFNARVRSWQASPILSMIDENYQKKIKQSNRALTISVVAISLLMALFLTLLVYVSNQRKKLLVARNALNEKNDALNEVNQKLTVANVNLDSSNRLLSESNEKLSQANLRLMEANKVKEEYIGRFLSLCSIYIDKMDGFRKMVNKKMRNKEFDSLYNLTKSLEFKENELNVLYNNFDAAFLNLFPDFVDQFNMLLKEESRIAISEKNQLTTELRIFALIRLGIEDSSKIAEFLHYSVNTIYNYRARVKNGALCDREQFERKVKAIGMLKN